MQDVLIRVHAKWDHVGQLDVPEAYVRRALVNEYLSWRRKWSRIVPHADVPEQGRTSPDHGEQLAQRSELATRLATLPPRQRAVLVLRYYEDLDDHAIAELLGCRPTTVRGYAARGLDTLRIDLSKERNEHAR